MNEQGKLLRVVSETVERLRGSDNLPAGDTYHYATVCGFLIAKLEEKLTAAEMAAMIEELRRIS